MLHIGQFDGMSTLSLPSQCALAEKAECIPVEQVLKELCPNPQKLYILTKT
jgi:hypothetical protein